MDSYESSGVRLFMKVHGICYEFLWPATIKIHNLYVWYIQIDNMYHRLLGANLTRKKRVLAIVGL